MLLCMNNHCSAHIKTSYSVSIQKCVTQQLKVTILPVFNEIVYLPEKQLWCEICMKSSLDHPLLTKKDPGVYKWVLGRSDIIIQHVSVWMHECVTGNEMFCCYVVWYFLLYSCHLSHSLLLQLYHVLMTIF